MTRAAAVFRPESTRAVLVAACGDVGLDPRGASLMRLGENALYQLASAPIGVRIARSMDYWQRRRRKLR